MIRNEDEFNKMLDRYFRNKDVVVTKDNVEEVRQALRDCRKYAMARVAQRIDQNEALLNNPQVQEIINRAYANVKNGSISPADAAVVELSQLMTDYKRKADAYELTFKLELVMDKVDRKDS